MAHPRSARLEGHPDLAPSTFITSSPHHFITFITFITSPSLLDLASLTV